MTDWRRFQAITESRWRHRQLEQGLYGFQIQPGTRWRPGLSAEALADVERRFGFPLPTALKEMLRAFNGFDTEEISIDPEGEAQPQTAHLCHRYPESLDEPEFLAFLGELHEHRGHVLSALEYSGWEAPRPLGYVPLYAHRALVVLEGHDGDGPVLSAMGDDVIVYAATLAEYWRHEFSLAEEF